MHWRGDTPPFLPTKTQKEPRGASDPTPGKGLLLIELKPATINHNNRPKQHKPIHNCIIFIFSPANNPFLTLSFRQRNCTFCSQSDNNPECYIQKRCTFPCIDKLWKEIVLFLCFCRCYILVFSVFEKMGITPSIPNNIWQTVKYTK